MYRRHDLSHERVINNNTFLDSDHVLCVFRLSLGLLCIELEVASECYMFLEILKPTVPVYIEHTK